MSGFDDLIHEFVAECGEGLDQLDGDLVELEERPADRDLLGRIFRTLHTIKGNCGFLNFARLGEMAHAGESLLGRIRDGVQQYDAQVADALLDFIDVARKALASIHQTGEEGDHDFQSTARSLQALATVGAAAASDVTLVGPILAEGSGSPASAPQPPALQGAVPQVPTSQASLTADFASHSPALPSSTPESPASVTSSKAARGAREPAASASAPSTVVIPDGASVPDGSATPAPKRVARLAPASGQPASQPHATGKPAVPVATPSHDRVWSGDVAEHRPGEPPEKFAVPAQVSSAKAPPGPAPPGPTATAAAAPPAKPKDEGSSGGLSSSNIRVDVKVLDDLMNLIGELVLARNQILQHTVAQKDPALSIICQRLNTVTTDLQEGFMRTRMQRIGGMWQKFPRVVRDVAKLCQKKVKLETHGAETELDKSLIEAISAPLTHVIRNSIDHGIEPPSLRKKHGKPEEGTITLRAYHEAGQVNIEVTDDGAGIDREKVRQKAVKLGLYSHDESVVLSDDQLMDSIFMPGFSTATEVTAVSGRGVGMDVVKTQIEAIGGMVHVETRPNLGTTVRMKVPLTLAIIPALIVRCAADRFAIPQVNLLELVSLDAAAAARSIETLHSAPVYRLRGNLLPLVSLRDVLGLKPEPGTPNGIASGPVNIIVLRAIDRRFGLVVDAIHNNQEIVVKPLGPAVQGLGIYAGVTILGDGRVSLILDVLGLARLSGVLSRQPARKWSQPATAGAPPEFSESVLVCDAGNARRIAIPLAGIERMDEFPRSALEQSGDHPVLQYRDAILPLYDVGALVYGHEPTIASRDPLRVVICRPGGRRVGLVVERVVDIAGTPRDPRPAHHAVVESSAVIDGRITDVLGLERLIEYREMAT